MISIGEAMSLIGEGLGGQEGRRSINPTCIRCPHSNNKVERVALVKAMKYNNGDFNFQTKMSYTIKMRF